MRSDLQRFYGIDIDHAMRGEHTPHHIAELVKFVPHDSALGAVYDEDSVWTMDRTLLAFIYNSLNLMMWGMSDKRKRGAKPEQILPKRMKQHKRSIDAQAMTIEELMNVLARDRI